MCRAHGSEKVPVIDLSQTEEAAAQEVRQACISAGFFYVSNHGVPDNIMERYAEQNRKFFALPVQEKLRILADKNNRGYTPMAEETLDPANQTEGDSKEGLYIGREIPADSEEATKPLHGPNQWPSEALLPDFRPVTMEYFHAMHVLGLRLVRLIALALQLPADHFDSNFDKPLINLRPLHYSAKVSRPSEGIYGAGAHTDYGMLTLLATDKNPGLQICLDGQWQDVPPMPGMLIVNLGDMLERWTNGMFRSTLHRVISTCGCDRYSTAFFLEPNFDTVVECLPQCCIDTPARFPPTTSGQHLLDKYAQTHAGLDAGIKKLASEAA
ncbi:hypothetical protein WJX72_000846 [[Myrmecia] bisecta]|uniref:Fe2OG dioxygenase domain-containing protein n=1 Tax=[Myrmecia] bisecta TaxID=41462 RepID=A0AAW1Q0E7_9CHLO